MHLKKIVYTLDVMTDDLATEVTTFPQEVSPTSHKAYSSQALLTTTMLTPTTTQQQFIDTRATHHITSNDSMLQKVRTYTSYASMLLGNGSNILITHIGSTYLFRGSCDLQLQNLLCVPQFEKNFIYEDNNVTMEFFSNSFCIKNVQKAQPSPY